MRAALIFLFVLSCRFGGPTPPGAPAPAPGDAAIDRAPEADAGGDAGADGLVLSVPDTQPEPDGCVAPAAPAVCDPVCNTGCPALSRCDVGEGSHTGACVGIWLTGEGGACFKGSGTDACAVKLTCHEGRCRRLCYRDADCTPGNCCNQELPSGFRVCSICHTP
jgi:hypothetical protein